MDSETLKRKVPKTVTFDSQKKQIKDRKVNNLIAKRHFLLKMRTYLALVDHMVDRQEARE